MARNLADAFDERPYGGLLRTIGEIAAGKGIEAYAVGGVVRDLQLGLDTRDVDFVTVGRGSGIALAEAVAEELGGRPVHVYPKFGTASIRLAATDPEKEDVVLEFVGARRESYRTDSRKPIVEEGSLQDDLERRDFTVNAMAADLHPARYGLLIDLFGGMADLEHRVLRTPLPPGKTFEDDPLRMIRAARFAAQLRFDVDEDVFDAMREQSHRVDMLSQERITEELQKMMCADVPSIGFKILFGTYVLQRILPELSDLQGVETVDGHRHKDNFYHTLQVLDNLVEMTWNRPCADTLWLRWAALLHDVAKPMTKRFSQRTGWTFHGHEDVGSRLIPKLFKELRLPTDERMKYVQEMIRLHHRPVALVDEDVTDSAVRRLLIEAGEHVDDLMTLVRADVTSKNPRRVRRYLEAFDRVEEKFKEVEEKDRLRNFQPPVDGHEIMDVLGIDEGVSIGIIKNAIREAILEGEIPNDHDAAFAYMMEIKDEALRRGELFDEVVRALEGPERAATGAIKEAVFSDEIPSDHDEAYAYLIDVKNDALRKRRNGD